jgi:hypothetical protein
MGMQERLPPLKPKDGLNGPPGLPITLIKIIELLKPTECMLIIESNSVIKVAIDKRALRERKQKIWGRLRSARVCVYACY